MCALGIVSLFAIFLAASQPHRVHHLLESLPAAAGHGDQDNAAIGDWQLAAQHAISEDLTAKDDSRPVEEHWEPHHRAGHHHHSDHAQTSRHGHIYEYPTRDLGPLTSADDSLRSDSQVHDENSSPLHAQNGPTDGHHDGQPKTDCATQSIAKHSHLSSIPAADISFVFCFLARLSDNGTDTRRFFVYLPFSQRAPPRL